MKNKQPNPTNQRFLRSRDVQQLLSVSKPTLFSLINSGQLPAVVLPTGKSKRTLRFRPSDVAKFVQNNLTSSAA